MSTHRKRRTSTRDEGPLPFVGDEFVDALQSQMAEESVHAIYARVLEGNEARIQDLPGKVAGHKVEELTDAAMESAQLREMLASLMEIREPAASSVANPPPDAFDDIPATLARVVQADRAELRAVVGEPTQPEDASASDAT